MSARAGKGPAMDPQSVTHVLYVTTHEVGADMVTRTSPLGSSGRVGYLGAVNTTWLLLDLAADAVVGGGPSDAAAHARHDLVDGGLAVNLLDPDQETPLGDDPLATSEVWLRAAVVVASGGLLVFAVVSLLRLIMEWTAS